MEIVTPGSGEDLSSKARLASTTGIGHGFPIASIIFTISTPVFRTLTHALDEINRVCITRNNAPDSRGHRIVILNQPKQAVRLIFVYGNQ